MSRKPRKRRSPPKEYRTWQIPRKHKTTTPEGKREYMKRYMQIRRAELSQGTEAITKINLEQTLGMDLSKLTKVQRPRG